MIQSHRITFTENQIREILGSTERVLRSGNVVLGEYTKAFEKEYAKYCGREYGVAVGSDTAAFEMQLKTLGVRDQYVIYPALAFPSILESVFNAGGIPWFVDGAWDGHLFARTEQIRDAIEECENVTGTRPKALILMHTGGYIARDAAEITELCEGMGIAVLEDAAHSFGAKLDRRNAGTYGLSSAFSLYATKPMHSCEGGMIVTDDYDLAEECRVYRNYGRTQDFGRSVIVRHGYSWRLTEIQAIIGISNLRSIGMNLVRRQEIMDEYDRRIEESESQVWNRGFVRLEKSDGMELNGYRYILIAPSWWDANRRMRFKAEMRDEGVDLPGEVYELPTHKQPIWEESYGYLDFPMAEAFCRRHFALPVYQSMTDDDVDQVFTTLERVLEKHVYE